MKILHEKVFKPLWDSDYGNNQIGPLYFISDINTLKSFQHATTKKYYADVIPKERWMDLTKAWNQCASSSKKVDPVQSVRARVPAGALVPRAACAAPPPEQPLREALPARTARGRVPPGHGSV